jgi:hypothetical protein
MNSFKFLVFFTLVALSVAEPPRRKSNFRTFGRQEAAESDKPAEGYNYDKPQGERLRLPSRFTFKKFGRQEETTSSSSNGGYHYPKPDNGYGPPEEETTDQPDNEYGTPDSTPSDIDDTTTTDAPSTDNPQAERLRGFNRKSGNAKLTRLQKTLKIRNQPIKPLKLQQQQQVQLQQPVIYFVDPVAADFIQPQFEYFYVLNK